jgi:hypothetical protein
MKMQTSANRIETTKYLPENNFNNVLIRVAARYANVNPKIKKGVDAVPAYGRFASK